MSSITRSCKERGLLVLLAALAACGSLRGDEDAPDSIVGGEEHDAQAAPSPPDAVEAAETATVETGPTLSERPLSIRHIRDDERAAYVEASSMPLWIKVTQDSEPELWAQIERLRQALGHKGEFRSVQRSDNGVVGYSTLTTRFANGNGAGAFARAVREGDGWLVLRQGRWIN